MGSGFLLHMGGNMHIVLLSGGSGKRLWPLSNDIRSKQFIKIFKKEDGTYESMIQRVYRQIKKIDENATVTIATSKTQVSSIHNQLGREVCVSIEPCRRDTFPAIALATAYLVDVMKVDPEESVVVCPVDPYVDDDYFEALKGLSDQANKDEANLVLMGIEPTYPSEKYGYIIPESADHTTTVKTFKEKPTTEVAEEYIKQGALWNSGVFAYRLKYVLDKAHEMIDFTDYQDLFAKYYTLKKISFDYAVVEKEDKIQVQRFAGQWKDLGTWNTLTEAMEEVVVGKGILNDECTGVHIVNEMDVPVLAMGLHDVVISVSPEGILVSDKEQSSYIKPFVDGIEQQIMFAEKSWGSFKVMDVEPESMTIKVTLNAGHSMNYHSHKNRDEVWVVISGNGKTVVEGVEQSVKAGEVITMSAGCRHTIMAATELRLIEVQLGKAISVEDKQKFDLEY
jgi:mannose-1-phosphate guanylyltransferase